MATDDPTKDATSVQGPVVPGAKPLAPTVPPKKKAPAKKAPAKAAANPTGGFTVASFMNALRIQESGANYTSRSSGGSASGAYQYIDSTWNNYKGYAHAWQAPKAVQDERARADITAAYKKYSGDWEKVAAAHFAGQGWVDAHPNKATWGVNPVPGSRNPTVSGYVSSMFSHANQKVSVTGASGGGQGAEPNASTSDIRTQVQQSYGYLAGFLDDPEIGPLLLKAAKEGWDTARLEGALSQTNFWKNNADVTRQWDAQSKLDPASQRTQIANQIADLQAQAQRSGVLIDPKRLSTLAITSLKYGWSAQRLSNALLAEGKLDLSGKNPSGALSTLDNLKTQAAQYMVPISDAALQKWTKDIQGGKLAASDFDGYLKEQAKSLFPTLAGAIDRGVTVEQYADPYRQVAAQTLEVDPQSIDFMHDPKYQKALYQIDPKTKDRSAMNLSDWGTYLRALPEYGHTHGAQQQAAAFTTSLEQTFGKVAG